MGRRAVIAGILHTPTNGHITALNPKWAYTALNLHGHVTALTAPPPVLNPDTLPPLKALIPSPPTPLFLNPDILPPLILKQDILPAPLTPSDPTPPL